MLLGSRWCFALGSSASRVWLDRMGSGASGFAGGLLDWGHGFWVVGLLGWARDGFGVLVGIGVRVQGISRFARFVAVGLGSVGCLLVWRGYRFAVWVCWISLQSLRLGVSGWIWFRGIRLCRVCLEWVRGFWMGIGLVGDFGCCGVGFGGGSWMVGSGLNRGQGFFWGNLGLLVWWWGFLRV